MEHKDTFARYAIFQIGTNQYQGIEGKTIQVQKLEGEFGDIIEFDEVLLRKTSDEAIEIGQPFVGGVVKASIVKQMKGPKIIIYHFRRRKKSRVKNGHRQQLTIIRIEAI
ncbi:50S ribosomal protein L21 [Candidatus Chromulinivorax destructor]|uniref:Large ribosomal subunit protein bL21 n=1 Tax=Candidatus Chromulinivorax destructor TaxID=2066483 RepID=A0A345ZCX4_9BACT|nr:50S ribosomal protein L21 [Candidatus Chromulinivorax destructor]AXK61141.1 50S ribosomal protein L21 [Candidatus Chromulinivorax destructor]